MSEENNNQKYYETAHRLTTGVLIPVCMFLYNEIKDTRTELAKYQSEQAKYHIEQNRVMVTRDDFIRLEQKVDDLKDLIIKEIMKKDK